MFYSIPKKRLPSLFTLLLPLSVIFIFASCSLLDSKNESGKIIFSLDDSLVRAILADTSEKDTTAIENTDVSESAREIFIEILGDEEKALASKILPLDSGQTALFEDLPLDVKVYARALIYRSGEDSSYLDFAGKSEEITIQEGENHLALNLDKYCLVKFDSLGGPEVESLEVKKNELFSAPESLERESSENGTSYTFDGWYTSEDSGLTLSEKYDFESPVSKDLTLYAKWNESVQSGFTLTLEIEENSDINVLLSEKEDSGLIYYTFTADEGYSTYIWKFDGREVENVSEDGSSDTSSNVFTLISEKLTVGVYDISLIAKKELVGEDGTSSVEYYSYYAQIKVLAKGE